MEASGKLNNSSQLVNTGGSIAALGRPTRFLGRAVNLDDKDPATNPFLREEMLDSPLTEKGRKECVARRSHAALLNPQAVIVSSLSRAIHTALLSFADHNTDDIPWIAHEGAREQLGLLMCNKVCCTGMELWETIHPFLWMKARRCSVYS